MQVRRLNCAHSDDEGRTRWKKTREEKERGGVIFFSLALRLFSETATRSRMATKLDAVELLKSLNLSLVYFIFSEKITHSNKLVDRLHIFFRKIELPLLVPPFFYFSLKEIFWRYIFRRPPILQIDRCNTIRSALSDWLEVNLSHRRSVKRIFWEARLRGSRG